MKSNLTAAGWGAASLVAMFLFPVLPARGEDATGPSSLTVTYLANEGFLLRTKGTSVIVDGLFRPGLPPYQHLPEEVLGCLEGARSPFDEVDLLLVTHRHQDHFEPTCLLRHLQHSPRAAVICPQEVARELRAASEGSPVPEGKIRGFALDTGDVVTAEHQGVSVQILPMPHAGERDMSNIQNHGYRIELGGFTILHLGDAEAEARTFRRYRLTEPHIDLALVPFWYFVDPGGAAVVADLVRARAVLAMHIPPSELASWTPRIRAADPEAVILARPLDRMRFIRRGDDGLAREELAPLVLDAERAPGGNAGEESDESQGQKNGV